MAVSDNILGPTAIGQPSVDPSGLGGGTGITEAPVNTLNFDPNSLQREVVTAGVNPDFDVPLAQQRIQPEVQVNQGETNLPQKKQEGLSRETSAAIGAAAGSAVAAGVSVWTNAENLKSQDQIFQAELQRGYQDMAYNQRMFRNNRNLAVLNESLRAMQDIKRQAGDVAAGGQKQQFFETSRGTI